MEKFICLNTEQVGFKKIPMRVYRELISSQAIVHQKLPRLL